MSGLDFSSLVSSADFASAVGAILGVAALMLVVYAAAWGAGKNLDVVSDDPWRGYTAEDDARDRAAAGLPPRE
jgi:hypothetical protein